MGRQNADCPKNWRKTIRFMGVETPPTWSLKMHKLFLSICQELAKMQEENSRTYRTILSSQRVVRTLEAGTVFTVLSDGESIHGPFTVHDKRFSAPYKK